MNNNGEEQGRAKNPPIKRKDEVSGNAKVSAGVNGIYNVYRSV